MCESTFLHASYNKFFSGYQLCQEVKELHFENHSHPKGTAVAGNQFCDMYTYLPLQYPEDDDGSQKKFCLFLLFNHLIHLVARKEFIIPTLLP